MTFKEYLELDEIDEIDEELEVFEGASKEATIFLKELNKKMSSLKDDVKTSETNNDWKVRAKDIYIFIGKSIKIS